MTDSTQMERQWQILNILSASPQGCTAEEIRNSLSRSGIEVSRKTVVRDIDNISLSFYVYEEVRDGKICYMADKFNLDRVNFTFSDLVSFHFIREILEPFNGIEIGYRAGKLIEKILQSSPTIDKKTLDVLDDILKIRISDIIPEKEFKPEYLELIQQAIENKRTLKLEYYGFFKDELTQRMIEPYLLEINEGCWHLVGNCLLRGAIRDFRVSRIKALDILEREFLKPPDFYNRYKEQRFEKLSGEENIFLKIKFWGDAARRIKEYDAAKADRIKSAGEYLIFEADKPYSPEIIDWVMSYGAEAEVISPDFLRAEITNRIEKIRNIYKN